MKLIPLIRILPPDEARITIRQKYICLNEPALKLLDVKEGDKVAFCVDDDEAVCGRIRVYVGKTIDMGMRLQKHKKTYCYHSLKAYNTFMSTKVASNLTGYGVYRIDPDSGVMGTEGFKYYNIFFKKYEG